MPSLRPPLYHCHAGLTIPWFFLALEESLSRTCEWDLRQVQLRLVTFSGWYDLFVCTVCVLVSQRASHGAAGSQPTWEWVWSLHKLAYLPLRLFTAYAGIEGAEAKPSPRLCWKTLVKEEAGSD